MQRPEARSGGIHEERNDEIGEARAVMPMIVTEEKETHAQSSGRATKRFKTRTREARSRKAKIIRIVDDAPL